MKNGVISAEYWRERIKQGETLKQGMSTQTEGVPKRGCRILSLSTIYEVKSHPDQALQHPTLDRRDVLASRRRGI